MKLAFASDSNIGATVLVNLSRVDYVSQPFANTIFRLHFGAGIEDRREGVPGRHLDVFGNDEESVEQFCQRLFAGEVITDAREACTCEGEESDSPVDDIKGFIPHPTGLLVCPWCGKDLDDPNMYDAGNEESSVVECNHCSKKLSIKRELRFSSKRFIDFDLTIQVQGEL